MLSAIFTCLWFDVTLQSDARKVPLETSVSAQLYVMTIVYAVLEKTIDLKINIGREWESDGIVKVFNSVTNTSCRLDLASSN